MGPSPFVLSLSKDERTALRQAQGQRELVKANGE